METGALLRDGVWEASGSGAPKGPKGTGVPEEGGWHRGVWRARGRLSAVERGVDQEAGRRFSMSQ